jgi:hypothetical protein
MPSSRSNQDRTRSRSRVGNDDTIEGCLVTIGVLIADLSECVSLADEFKVIKKHYFKKILVAHPDKGGDAETFRQLNEAFQKIRVAFEKRAIDSFSSAASASKTFEGDLHVHSTYTEEFKSWDFYFNAAEEDVPLYKVELAKSGRSKCVQRGKEAKKCDFPNFIEKGAIRVGSINLESGSYGRWSHLMCWRVPSKIWEGLPDPDICKDDAKFEAALSSMNEVLLCGFDQLSPNDKSVFINHVRDKGNWANRVNRKPQGTTGSASKKANQKTGKKDKAGAVEPTAGSSQQPQSALSNALTMVAQTNMPSSSNELTLSRKRKAFSLVPGQDGAQPNFFSKKTIVMTGIFPEIGGGAGLNLGKDRLKVILESFGARVTSSVSGRTDFLIVGQEPGMSKVSKARAQPKCKLLNLSDMKLAVEGKKSLGEIEPPQITNYSFGYQGNGLARLGY